MNKNLQKPWLSKLTNRFKATPSDHSEIRPNIESQVLVKDCFFCIVMTDDLLCMLYNHSLIIIIKSGPQMLFVDHRAAKYVD